MDDIVTRLRGNTAKYPGFQNMNTEAADEIERLRVFVADVRKAMYAEHDESDDDVLATLRFDQKYWMSACNAIRSGQKPGDDSYPSMVDRWWYAAMDKELTRLRKIEEAARGIIGRHAYESELKPCPCTTCERLKEALGEQP